MHIAAPSLFFIMDRVVYNTFVHHYKNKLLIYMILVHYVICKIVIMILKIIVRIKLDCI